MSEPNVTSRREYSSNHMYLPAFFDPQFLLNPSYALFAPYLRTAAIYKCPADQSTLRVAGKEMPKIRSYSLNCYVGTPAGSLEEPFMPAPGFRYYIKSSEIASDLPANKFVFMDVNPANLCTPTFGVDMAQDIFFHYPSTLHSLSGVAGFAGGHAESHRWVDPRTRKTVPNGQIISHTDTSPNNLDLKWIRDRTTSRN